MRRLQITGTDLQTGCPGIPHFYGRIDSQPEGIDQIFGKEHPERRSSSFDQQGAKSPFFKFGNDQSSRDLCGGHSTLGGGSPFPPCRRGPGSEQEVKTIFS